MPYIKKIELKGFKSFGPRTSSIVLDKGFTVLTGPNGSGKTNIVDGILFGLGELSSRRLRAENLGKLIFHGSAEAGINQAKAAKCIIQFDNHDKRIPIETNTVTVSREIRNDGQSIYRLNGRRISRTRVLDMLSMAGISAAGHNIILQGNITSMTEITSSGRRKIISDLVGIAQYDAEKAEAEEKLREAEISIRTAMGRTDEVQKRVDALERERNELLRNRFLTNEVKRLEATKISYEIIGIKKKIDEITAKKEQIQNKVEEFRQLKEQLRSERREIENEWRHISSDLVEDGTTQLLEVQIKVGDVKSKLTELATKISAGTASLEGLRKVRENNRQQLETAQKEIVENRKRIQRLKRERGHLIEEIDLKQSQYATISNEISELRANLGENSKKVRKVEQQLSTLNQSVNVLRRNSTQSQLTIKSLSRRLKDLGNRKNSFTLTSNDLKKSLLDLRSVQKEQIKSLKMLEQTLDRRIIQSESVRKEIAQARKIAKAAREAVVEFATQRELADKVATEEHALRNIEELADLGVISGVYGRLRNLIKAEKGYMQAIDATAAGWLDSIVVQDFNTAFTCAETLKRLKLGRIKIIPLEELSAIKSINTPRLTGVSGPVSAYVKSSKRYEAAVLFVFGDTLVTSDEKTAFAASRQGHRTVTINGDLYEAGGGLESGYYRAPFDFSSIIPSESAVKNLDEAVVALQKHLTQRVNEISTFGEEIEKTKIGITQLTESISTIDNEIERIRRSVKRTTRNIRSIERQIQKLEDSIEREKSQISLQKAKRKSLQKEINALQKELAILRGKIDPFRIQEMEIKREKLADEAFDLRQTLGIKETELSTLQSKVKNVLKISADNVRIPLRKLKWQISVVEKEVEEANLQKEALENEVTKLEKTREELSQSLLKARGESKEFTSKIYDLDKKLHKLDAKYEHSDRLFNQLQLDLQTNYLHLEQYYYRLKELGYEKHIEVSPEQFMATESSLKLMRFELERLGAVNQLALSHYAEQASRYKELSLRMNELESEKQSILSFMDEIERKKRKIFMDAFNQLHRNLKRYFSKLTGGGEVMLKLDNPEEPLAGGIDMVVQFPGKPPIVASGASGGERSVSAVAFIFAMQDFMSASFYLLDEVDAHLDAFHVGKLGELLVEESSKSQFVVVTLKPEMVSKAEKVYGIYERKGVSHVVSATFQGVD